MADVRLTATNPEDSSVVPVACNEKGELKLEEIPDQSFDGNLQGNLTVSGNATFAGTVITKQVSSSSTNGADKIFTGGITNSAENFFVKADGSASFAGQVDSGNISVGNGCRLNPNGNIEVRADGGIQPAYNVFKDGTSWSNSVAFILNDGSANFASRKAGFTAEGYLWCTTRRGDTVILDATSNGLASWVPYTPPNGLTELQDKLAELKPGPPTDIDSSRLTKD